jgi:hypothetical protein
MEAVPDARPPAADPPAAEPAAEAGAAEPAADAGGESDGLWLTRVSGHRATTWTFGAVSFALCAWALASRWGDVVNGFAQIGIGRTLLSTLPMLVGLALGMLAWKFVLGAMGSRLPFLDAASMYFMGQIGKYVPGSLWPVAAQMELGKHYRIPRSRSATSILLALCVSLTTGVAVVLCAVPLLDPETAHRSVWLLAVLPFLLAMLYPPLLWWVLKKVPRVGASLALGPTPRVRDIAYAALAASAGWVAYGLHVWILMTSFGPELRDWRSLAISTGGYAFAWVAGLLFFILPAGAGARDLSLVVALSAVLPTPHGLAVAVLSRGVSIVCDLATAGVSAVRIRRVRTRWERDGGDAAEVRPAVDAAGSSAAS